MSTAGATLGFVGRLAAMLGPPGIVLQLFPDWIQQHPVPAIMVVLGYETVLLALSFFRGIVTEIEKRWQARFVDRFDGLLARKLSRFDRRYRQFVLGTLRFVDLKGLATVGPYTPQLDEVFVDLHLVPRSPHLVRPDPFADAPAELTERSSLQDFLDQPVPKVLAVVGAAGCGKTTLLRHTARQICRPGGRRRTVPIFLLLRDHGARILENPDVTVADLMRGTLGQHRAAEPPEWFEQKLRDGACVVLLDGLDEITPDEGRRAVSEWVERQIGQFPDNDYVITSRPGGYRVAEIGGATVLQVRPFTAEQVSQFLRGWYRAVERLRKGIGDSELESHVDTVVTDLLEQVRNTAALQELTVNPLLLTMIANVHVEDLGALPHSRAELYNEICEVMLWRRDIAKRLPAERDNKELLLRHLAFAMMQARVRDLPRAGVLEALKPLLRRVSQQLTPDRFLEEVGSSGLLIERENGLYSFAHHTFQEHLAAVHIHDKGLTRVLAGTVDDVWWRDCTLLYAARADPDLIIGACLGSQSEIALALAFDCAREARELDPRLKTQLEELLAASYEADTDPGRRRLMARVMLARHLRRYAPAADASPGICAQPITVDIYRLFLADTGAQAPDDPRPFELESDEPVIGAHPADVLEFVRWANEIAGSDSTFRLPGREEAADPAVQRALDQQEPPLRGRLSVWLKPDAAGVPQLWTPQERPHPHRLTSGALVGAVHDDLRGSVPTLPWLLLARSLVLLRSVRFDLDRGFVGDRAREAACRLVEGLARAAELALVHADDDEFALALALDPAVACADELARALTREIDNALAFDLARLRALAQARKLEYLQALDLSGRSPWRGPRLATADERDWSLTRDLGYIRRLVRTLEDDLDRALETHPERTLDTVLGLGHLAAAERAPIPAGAVDRHVEGTIGRALSDALSRTLQDSGSLMDDRGQFADDFARAFVASTGVEATDWTVSPGSLASHMRAVCAEARTAAAEPGSDWLLDATTRLERLAVPVFGRECPMSAATAAALRIGALCLAVELECCGRSGTGFRRLAAGTSLLELRRTSRTQPTETIVLVTA